MEILSSIKYGRCFNFNNIHSQCIYCCCECKLDCTNRCGHSKYNFKKTNCGNYKDVVQSNNEQLLNLKLIDEKLKEVRSNQIICYKKTFK